MAGDSSPVLGTHLLRQPVDAVERAQMKVRGVVEHVVGYAQRGAQERRGTQDEIPGISGSVGQGRGDRRKDREVDGKIPDGIQEAPRPARGPPRARKLPVGGINDVLQGQTERRRDRRPRAGIPEEERGGETDQDGRHGHLVRGDRRSVDDPDEQAGDRPDQVGIDRLVRSTGLERLRIIVGHEISAAAGAEVGIV